MSVRPLFSMYTGCATGVGSVCAWIATNFVFRNEKGSLVSFVIRPSGQTVDLTGCTGGWKSREIEIRIVSRAK